MGLLRFFKNVSDLDQKVVDKGFEVASCSYECETCDSKFPSSVKRDEDPLWESTRPYGLHILVSTGKTDWPHDATGTKNTLSHSVAKWGDSNSEKYPEIGKIKVTVSSLSSDELITNDEYSSEKRGDILLLPFFVWIKNVTLDEVDSVLTAVVPDLVAARNENSAKLPLNYPQFSTVKFEVDSNQSYIFLCSHRTRDKRCGITAPIMKKEMDIYLREKGLIRDHGDKTPNGVTVGFINHIGGHKFSANVILYLRSSGKNIWLARCSPNNCRPIIDECVLKGTVFPDSVRIIQKFDPIAW